MTPTAGQITFQTLIGPTGGDFTFQPGKPVSIGRAAGSDICLLHDAVSRKHAAAMCRGEQWFISDLGSKSGTLINGVRLEPETPTLVKPGDLVKVGPWTFRLLGPGGVGGEAAPSLARTIDDSAGGARLERAYVNEGVLQSDRRLRLLVDFIGRLGTAQANAVGPQAEAKLATAALESVLSGSGYTRGAVLRQAVAGDQVEVVATARQPGADTADFSFSRSLVSQAAKGEVAILTRDAPQHAAGMQSIADLRIHSALCAPILIGESVQGFMYLDARGSERSVRTDAAGFCEAAARAYGLALSNLMRINLEERHRHLHDQLTAARKTQEMILPSPEGNQGSLRYAMRMRPGLFVAGDLFDVVPLGDGRVMACIGDVAGHGIAPAMLMAMVQSQLHAQIMRYGDPAKALSAVNQYLCPRSTGGRFASLWVGVFEPDGMLRYVDGGHGHWLISEPDAHWRHLGSEGAGLPIGVDPDCVYETQQVRLPPGSRVLLHSDGITEQKDPTGADEFGRARLEQVLVEAGGRQPSEVATEVFRRVTEFAGLTGDAELNDDATVAVVHVG